MGVYADRVIADGASYYWRLNELAGTVAQDQIGSVNGTISGGVTLNQQGAIVAGDLSLAMAFDGTTGQIVTAPSVTTSADCTIEAWVRAPALALGSFRPMLSTRTASPTIDTVYVGLNAAGVVVILDSDSQLVIGTTVIADGAWHHVVYTSTAASSHAVYVDGIAQQTTPGAAHGSAAAPAAIGFDAQSTIFWLGALDEVAIYPRALTSTQIAAHYALGTRYAGLPVNSTGVGLATNPASTGVVVATIDSTQLSVLTNGLSGPGTHGQLVRCTARLGGNSSYMWRIEQSASSTITDAPRVSVPVFTPAGQTGQYAVTMDLQPGDLVRARGSDTGTGTFTAFLQVDPLPLDITRCR